MVGWWRRSVALARLQTAGASQFGVQMKTSGCVAFGGLPDRACAPGDNCTAATKNQLRVSGYSSAARDAPQRVKERVYAAYGITSQQPGQVEVVQLVNLCIGGSNDISNLWPEAASPKPGFYEQDQVEVYFQGQVCSGKIDLRTAQIQIAPNWLEIYNQIT